MTLNFVFNLFLAMQASGKNPTINSCWTKFLRQSRLFYGAALMIGFMLVLSTMFVNEHNFKVCSTNFFSICGGTKHACYLVTKMISYDHLRVDFKSLGEHV